MYDYIIPRFPEIFNMVSDERILCGGGGHLCIVTMAGGKTPRTGVKNWKTRLENFGELIKMTRLLTGFYTKRNAKVMDKR